MNFLNGIEIVKLFTPRGHTVDIPWVGALTSTIFGLANATVSRRIMSTVTSICQISFLIVCILIPPSAYINVYGVKTVWGITSIFLIVLLIALGAGTLYAIFTRSQSG